jgi:hypothetical protein
LYKNCAGCAIRKLHLAVLVVLVAIYKSQLAVRKKASKKLHIKMLMKLTPGLPCHGLVVCAPLLALALVEVDFLKTKESTFLRYLWCHLTK